MSLKTLTPEFRASLEKMAEQCSPSFTAVDLASGAVGRTVAAALRKLPWDEAKEVCASLESLAEDMPPEVKLKAMMMVLQELMSDLGVTSLTIKTVEGPEDIAKPDSDEPAKDDVEVVEDDEDGQESSDEKKVDEEKK